MKHLRKLCSCVCLALLLLLTVTAGAAGIADALIPDHISVFQGELPIVPVWSTLTLDGEKTETAHLTRTDATVRLFGILPIKEVEVRELREMRLCPGGEVFGIRTTLGGAMVTALTSIMTEQGERCPAREAGLRRGDLITAAGATPITSATDLAAALAAAGGRQITLTVTRGGTAMTLSLTPVCAAGGVWRAGVLVKDSVAGIGTITFVNPETGLFGGLGHGVYDGITPSPVSITRGLVTEVGLSGVRRGEPGEPGELRGHLEAERLGTLLSNTECGVFGVLASPKTKEEAIPIGLRGDVTLGEAEILSTVKEGPVCRYRIEITSLRGEKGNDRSFSIRITDQALLDETGGIVQGMSGSPIIQNGKLIGAVTHVMIGDPTAGYGIFIENMLSAAETPMQKAA